MLAGKKKQLVNTEVTNVCPLPFTVRSGIRREKDCDTYRKWAFPIAGKNKELFHVFIKTIRNLKPGVPGLPQKQITAAV